MLSGCLREESFLKISRFSIVYSKPLCGVTNGGSRVPRNSNLRRAGGGRGSEPSCPPQLCPHSPGTGLASAPGLSTCVVNASVCLSRQDPAQGPRRRGEGTVQSPGSQACLLRARLRALHRGWLHRTGSGTPVTHSGDGRHPQDSLRPPLRVQESGHGGAPGACLCHLTLARTDGAHLRRPILPPIGQGLVPRTDTPLSSGVRS